MQKKLFVIVAILTMALIGCNTDTETTSKSEVKKYTLEFNTMGGENIPSQKLEAGSTFTLPTPTKKGKDFCGWYTEKMYINKWTGTVMPKKNVTLYAKWVKDVYSFLAPTTKLESKLTEENKSKIINEMHLPAESTPEEIFDFFKTSFASVNFTFQLVTEADWAQSMNFNTVEEIKEKLKTNDNKIDDSSIEYTIDQNGILTFDPCDDYYAMGEWSISEDKDFLIWNCYNILVYIGRVDVE